MIDRFSPLPLGGSLVAANRLVVPPMASQTAEESGEASAQTLAHYARLALAGAAITFVEYTYVHASGRSEPNQLGLASAAQARALAPVAAALKASGTIPGIQLTHSGGKTERAMSGGVLMGPSDVAVPAPDRSLEPTTPMSRAEIALWVDAFATAAARAAALGFAIVELHAAHGYGLNQWISPLTNRRQDEYGGSLAGRARILLEIIAAIRVRAPGLVLAVRIPGQDLLPGGLTPDDAVALARHLRDAGVDLIDVSSGLGGWRRPKDRAGEGYLVAEAAVLQGAVGAPVIGVGGIKTGAYIDLALAQGQLSLAAVGRAILEDPAAWRAAQMQRSPPTPPTPPTPPRARARASRAMLVT